MAERMEIMSIYPTEVNPKKYGMLGDKVEPISKLRPKPEKDILLIVGDGWNVWDDLERFFEFGVEHDAMLINHIAMVYAWPYQHYVAGDSHMGDMQKIARKLPKSVIKHCWNPNSKYFDVRWIRNGRAGWSGTTANLAVKVGIMLDYLKLVLAGIPMDNKGHWYDEFLPENDRKRKSLHAAAHLWKWTELSTRPIARFIRSMSGNTADLFGKPTKEWLLDI